MKGKLSIDELENVVMKHLTYHHPDVLVRAAIGKDCAAVDFGEDALVITTDPITGASSGLGELAVNVNLNDLATTGCKAIGLMMTILAPPNTSKDAISDIIGDAANTAKAYGVEIIGGHTEWTDAVNQIVISVTAIGKQDKRQILSRPQAVAGDLIAVTKSVGIEGVGILAYEYQELLKDILSIKELNLAKAMLDQTSVVKEGVLAAPFKPSVMHDVTEGGLLGGIWEVCYGADVGCKIYKERIPIKPITDRMASLFKIDPLRLISSGTMLMIGNADTVSAIEKLFSKENIALTVIGEITTDKRRLMIDIDTCSEIEPPKGDALFSIDLSNIKSREVNR